MGNAAWSKPEERSQLTDVTQRTDVGSVHSDESEKSQLPENLNKPEEDEGSRAERRQQELDNFKQMLEQKRDERQQVISRISEELNNLRQSKEDLEKEKLLRIGLEKQVAALKEVSTVSNEMLQLRETQVLELKKRLQIMEATAEENLTALRTQYENQIENIRKLRLLYEERAEAAERGHRKEIEKERAKNLLLELKLDDYTKEVSTKQQLQEKVEELEKQLAEKENVIDELKSERSSLVAECNNLTSQQSLINNLFSNMLTGEMDFDLLTQLLQDNHNLITDLIANGDINDTASLLVNIAEKAYKKPSESSDHSPLSLSAKEEIASNLPKVWRMLIELLSSHENCSQVQGTSDECYKHVNTPSGSRTVISVSQTFLRLKDLILEKNSLVKEVGRLKTLNGHLENRLDLQEKRLSVVCSELRKTWGIVSKLKVQHRQLHTHEKVLRYELQHKRQMLTDLKHELEYCKETWDKAREKNKETEHDWEILRKEFALRKSRDASNSAESGYDDDENSQSPDVSSSELEYDLSPLSDGQKLSELDVELEDAASDATVIELIDMLEFEQDDVPYNVPQNDDIPVEISKSEATPKENEMISDSSESSKLEDQPPPAAASKPTRTAEEILAARAARLRRLEQQCCSLLNQMALTSLRSDTLSTRLEELHEQYGSEERRSLTRQNAEIETEKNEPSTTEENLDRRSDRVQMMEQNCMQMFENVSSEEGLELRLENVQGCGPETSQNMEDQPGKSDSAVEPPSNEVETNKTETNETAES